MPSRAFWGALCLGVVAYLVVSAAIRLALWVSHA